MTLLAGVRGAGEGELAGPAKRHDLARERATGSAVSLATDASGA